MGKTADSILSVAASFIGVKESPPNSNNVIFNTHYYGRQVNGAYAWCVAFVWDVFRMAGASDLFYGGEKTAYCPAVVSYAKKHGQWVTSGYRKGDCVLFNWDGGTIAKHIGIVESVKADGSVITIEGNTAVGNDSNGGEVMRRTRKLSNILGAYRPAYENHTVTVSPVEKIQNGSEETKMAKDDVISLEGTGDKPSAWAKTSTERMKKMGIFRGDGKGNYGWQEPVTREALATILDNFMEKIREQ